MITRDEQAFMRHERLPCGAAIAKGSDAGFPGTPRGWANLLQTGCLDDRAAAAGLPAAAAEEEEPAAVSGLRLTHTVRSSFCNGVAQETA